MFLTVTLNSAIDQVILVDKLAAGQSTEASDFITCVGGKGLDVSVALRSLEARTCALAFMGGANGRQLEKILAAYGIEPEIVWVNGETRICYVIAESARQIVSHIKLGRLIITPAHIECLVERYRALVRQSRWAILAGSIPASIQDGIYAELIQIANQNGVPTLIDSQGGALIEALKGKPAVVKMNRDEFEQTFDIDGLAKTDLCGALRNAAARYELETLIVTCGKDGIYAHTPDGMFRVKVPTLQAVNPAGAGDAASAGLVWRLDQEEGWEEALRWMGAVSAASVLSKATAELSLEKASEIYKRVEVMEIPFTGQ